MIDSSLLHTCTIERSRSTRDSHGASKLTWYDLVTDVICRLVEKVEKVGDTPTAEAPTVTRYILLLVDERVREGDRITDVVDEAGAALPGVYRIEEVLHRRSTILSHISLRLEKVA